MQPRVATYGLRKTAHIYGAVSLDAARFNYFFAPVFNGQTFLAFLQQLVRRYRGRKVFLVIDNGPCHWLAPEGQRWLREHRHLIELHRLPPYSPDYMPMEGVWKATRRHTTHNAFFLTTDQRDLALRATFQRFQRTPSLIEAHVERFR